MAIATPRGCYCIQRRLSYVIGSRRASSLLIVLLAACGSAPPNAPTFLSPAPSPPALVTLPVWAARIADGDGTRAAAITPSQLTEWVAAANEALTPAGISLVYSPSSGLARLDDSTLNAMMGTSDRNWSTARSAANALAGQHPGELVVLVRNGPDAMPTGTGFSWSDYDFVVMPSFEATTACGHQNRGLLAHEAGHYFGLYHTFAVAFPTIGQAEERWASAGRTAAVFDGDGLVDTSPDPYVDAPEWRCNSVRELRLGDMSFVLPRENLMAYYDAAHKGLTPEQAAVVRQVALLRTSGDLRRLVPGATRLIEGEILEAAATGPRQPVAQANMGVFHGRWSGSAQLFWRPASAPAHADLRFALPEPGRYRIHAVFTRGPDFGIHTLTVNGTPARAVDLYGSQVTITPPIDLGTHVLTTSNGISVETTASNRDSSGLALGLDYLLLSPASE